MLGGGTLDHPARSNKPLLTSGLFVRHFMPQFPVRRHWKVVLVLGCLAATAALVAVLTHKAEPRYQGHTLSHWLAASGAPSERERTEARAAITQIGSNAIPCLLRFISYTPSPWKKHSMTAFRKLQSLPFALDLIPRALIIDERELRAAYAEDAFRLLGNAAVSATPQLKGIAFDSAHRQSSERAIRIFLMMQPLPKDELTEILCDAPSDRRVQTLLYLTVNRNADMIRELLPALTKCLHDRDETIAKWAAYVIVYHKFSEPEATLGLLVDATKHPSPTVRVDVLKCIGTFQHGAASAVPKLVPFLTDPDRRVRIEATNTFRIIAPEVLNNGPAG